MNTYPALAVLILPCLLLTACSTFNDPNQVITVDTNKSKVLLLQADKRAIFTFPTRTAYACPEPSPDVKADIEAALKSVAELSAKLPHDVTLASKSEVEATRKLITAALIQRSQGLQVLRDMLFQACLANLRNDLSGAQYVSFVTNTLPNLTSTLITAEMITRENTGTAVLKGDDLKYFLNFVIGNNASR
ncbi:hypothetical protein [Nitrospira sp. BLG_1]|uniref:hypothetical protein n=1 Tax=Nitrospira sp. BLG_1 TaxID=3395883 RepID=UPI0039BC4B3F